MDQRTDIKRSPGRALPFAPFEWLIAYRYLRARRASGSVSMIAIIALVGIAVGVAGLIVTTSIFNGFHKDLFEKLVDVNGHIFVQAADRNMRDYDSRAADLSRIPGIKLAVPLVEGQAAFSSPFYQAGGYVRGIEERDIKRLPGIEGHVKSGTLDGFDTAEGVAIGQRLAESLGLRVGDRITLITAKGAQTPFGNVPRNKTYPVKAIFQVGMSIFDSAYVFMPLAEAQAYFDKDGEATLIEVFLQNPDDIDKVRDEIALAAKDQIIMTDWRETNRPFFETIMVERNVVSAIVGIIVVIAALNIISGLIMLVKDKGSAIAILRTVGATRGAIMRIFLLSGMTISIVGTAIGVVLGLVIALNGENIRAALNASLHWNLFPAEIYYLSRLPTLVIPSEVVKIVLVSLAVSTLATLYPSWRAARLDPVEALRYE